MLEKFQILERSIRIEEVGSLGVYWRDEESSIMEKSGFIE